MEKSGDEAVRQQWLAHEERTKADKAYRALCALQDAVDGYFQLGAPYRGESDEMVRERTERKQRISQACWEANLLREARGEARLSLVEVL
jgi:hypothetical protein